MKWLGKLLVFIGSLGTSCSAFAQEQCDPKFGIRLSSTADAPWIVQIQFKPKDLPLNAPFDATVAVCSQQKPLPSRITIDAIMPAHKHGMNYEPKIAEIDRGHYEVKNLVFHMPGIWRFEVTAYENKKPFRFTHDVALP